MISHYLIYVFNFIFQLIKWKNQHSFLLNLFMNIYMTWNWRNIIFAKHAAKTSLKLRKKNIVPLLARSKKSVYSEHIRSKYFKFDCSTNIERKFSNWFNSCIYHCKFFGYKLSNEKLIYSRKNTPGETMDEIGSWKSNLEHLYS